MNTNQKGFGHVGLVVAIVVLVLVGLSGWFVWKKNNQDKKDVTTITSKDEKPANKEENKAEGAPVVHKLTFDKGRVSFTLPEGWTYEKQDICAGFVDDCIESVNIRPGEDLAIKYGDGTEYFRVYAGVFDNPRKFTAQTWLENTGIGTGQVVKVNDSINGYDTFQRTEQYDSDGTRIVDYVFVSNDKTVHVTARTYDIDRDRPEIGDFRKFEPVIDIFARSVKITY